MSSVRSALEGMLIRSIAWGELAHREPAVGKLFSATQLRGYFNDLRSQSRRPFRRDAHGIPMLRGPHCGWFYHPITVCQVALGDYDTWLAAGADRDWAAFESASRWLVAAEDSGGGWVTFRSLARSDGSTAPIGVPREWVDAAGPYSGMTQGQAISVLARAYCATGEKDFLSAAQKAFQLLTKSVSRGGVSCWHGSDVSIEELPTSPRNTILNGWVFGLFGVRDLWLATKAEAASRFLQANIRSLASRLPEFDTGWWSCYDESGHIAKPFYHALHVAQLSALSKVDGSRAIQATAERWDTAQGRIGSVRALAEYGLQRAARFVQTVSRPRFA